MNINFLSSFKKYNIEIVGLILIIIYYLPYYILGEKAFYVIGDHLESLVFFKALQDEHALFKSSNYILSNFSFYGLPRGIIYSEWYYLTWLFYYTPFHYYYAVLIFNYLFISIVAYLGSYLFIKNYLLKWLEHFTVKEIDDFSRRLISAGVSSCFYAIKIHWTLGGLSTAGIPLLFYGSLKLVDSENLFYKKNIPYWLIILTFSFFTEFYYSEIFLYQWLLVFLLIYKFIRRIETCKITLVFMILIIVSNLMEYRLYYTILNGFISPREMIKPRNLSVIGHIKETLLIMWQTKKDFIDGYTGVFIINKVDAWFIFLLMLGIIILLFIKKSYRLLFLVLSLFVSFFVILQTFENYIGVKTFLYKIVAIFPKLMPILGLSLRYGIIHSFFWLIMFTILVYAIIIQSHSKYTRIMIIILFFIINYLYFTFHKDCNCGYSLQPIRQNFIDKSHPTYSEIFDNNLFNEIDKYITKNYGLQKNQYKTLTFNPPVDFTRKGFGQTWSFILQVNGFRTITGYFSFNDVRNHQKMCELVNNKFNDMRYYEIPLDSTWVDRNYTLHKLDINYNVLKEFNVKFVISILKIDTNRLKNFDFKKSFTGKYWTIYLYEIKT